MDNEKPYLSIKKEYKNIGNRLNILVLKDIDNNDINRLFGLMAHNGLFHKIAFNHYGRPTKCYRLFNDWIQENKLVSTDWFKSFLDELKRKDELLFGKK